MSPEQVEGKQKLDWRSDIYALGVMLFEMVTGRQPYEAETMMGQLFKHVMEPVPDVLHANAELPMQTQTVIDRVMAKDREERHQTAVALA
jgi:serine/threonine-protein kinase